MSSRKSLVIGLVAALAALSTIVAEAKPLKVYIMAGQSNMQGKARGKTIERMLLTGGDKQLYGDMMDKDGTLILPKDVHEVYFTVSKRGWTVDAGPAWPGFGKESNLEASFGPDYTFGIYMQKHLNEPFLIIKTAWGGKSLRFNFRPPSAGGFTGAKDKFGEPEGHFYNKMLENVNTVLADLDKYHPAYKKEDGYEIAGFVWFQGYNDMIAADNEVYRATADKPAFAEYTRLMACFIRDVRKDLAAPKMPFVIGVVGFDGPISDEKNPKYQFREAQAATAALPEFAGNVVAARTADCWDMELQRINDKASDACRKKLLIESPKMGPRAISQAIERGAAAEIAPEVLSPEELKIYQTGQSNASFHYMGSAQIYGKIGKVFADAMIGMEKH
jgi:hypothetical protein